VVPLAELERRQAWRQGFLVFNGEPLSEVIAEVNRYTPMRIEIADPALNTLKVGGRFRVGEFESMFDVLEKSFGVEVAHLGDQRIQLRARGDQ
jgi:transmembrane sensor